MENFIQASQVLTPMLSGNYYPDTVEPATRLLPASRTDVHELPQTMLGEETHSFRRSPGTSSLSLSELRADPVFGQIWQAPIQPLHDPVRQAEDHRLAILARKYEGTQLTREDEARVAILTQRLRRLLPRVTAKSWTIAEESVEELEAVAASVVEIRAKYGL